MRRWWRYGELLGCLDGPDTDDDVDACSSESVDSRSVDLLIWIDDADDDSRDAGLDDCLDACSCPADVRTGFERGGKRRPLRVVAS